MVLTILRILEALVVRSGPFHIVFQLAHSISHIIGRLVAIELAAFGSVARVIRGDVSGHDVPGDRPNSVFYAARRGQVRLTDSVMIFGNGVHRFILDALKRQCRTMRRPNATTQRQGALGHIEQRIVIKAVQMASSLVIA